MWIVGAQSASCVAAHTFSIGLCSISIAKMAAAQQSSTVDPFRDTSGSSTWGHYLQKERGNKTPMSIFFPRPIAKRIPLTRSCSKVVSHKNKEVNDKCVSLEAMLSSEGGDLLA